MYCKQRSQYVRPNSKKNSFRWNYSRKYGMYLDVLALGKWAAQNFEIPLNLLPCESNDDNMAFIYSLINTIGKDVPCKRKCNSAAQWRFFLYTFHEHCVTIFDFWLALIKSCYFCASPLIGLIGFMILWINQKFLVSSRFNVKSICRSF